MGPSLWPDCCGSPEGLFHVLLHLLLLQKSLHGNDMSDVAFISPGSEGDHLVAGPVRELYLDFGGFLSTVGVHRLHIWNWGVNS